MKEVNEQEKRIPIIFIIILAIIGIFTFTLLADCFLDFKITNTVQYKYFIKYEQKPLPSDVELVYSKDYNGYAIRQKATGEYLWIYRQRVHYIEESRRFKPTMFYDSIAAKNYYFHSVELSQPLNSSFK